MKLLLPFSFFALILMYFIVYILSANKPVKINDNYESCPNAGYEIEILQKGDSLLYDLKDWTTGKGRFVGEVPASKLDSLIISDNQ